MSVLYVSHRLEEVLTLADRVTVLRDGRVVTTEAAARLDAPGLVRRMSGELHTAASRRRRRIGDKLLAVTNLRVGADPGGVDLAVHRHEIVGLYGLLGAGRSETLHALYGAAVAPGQLRLDGQAYRPRTPADAIAHGIALVPEDRRIQALDLGQSVRFNLTLPLLPRFRLRPRLPVPAAPRERAFVRRIGAALGLRFTGPEQPVRELSGGNQQKIVVGRWFGRDNALYLFDEPTRGIDVRAKADIHAEIRGLADRGAGVLIASSDLPELMDLAGRILVLRDGAVAAEFVAADTTPAQVVAACYGQDIAA